MKRSMTVMLMMFLLTSVAHATEMSRAVKCARDGESLEVFLQNNAVSGKAVVTFSDINGSIAVDGTWSKDPEGSTLITLPGFSLNPNIDGKLVLYPSKNYVEIQTMSARMYRCN